MDDNVIGFGRSGMGLSDTLDLLDEKPPASTPGEAEDDFPRPGDEYTAAGRTSNKPEEMIAFLLRDQTEELFSYSGLERARLLPPAGPGQGRTLLMRFNGSIVTEVRIEGRNLRSLVPNLRRQRIPWLRETPTPGDFAVKAVTVITSVTIAEIER